ncbi:MAG: flagellar basal body-associated FliL family protein [Beijerinckiaceae bacterium]|nr:flagellar basal body-associated FliL family protein [Beijerinckiaceae bacterium]
MAKKKQGETDETEVGAEEGKKKTLPKPALIGAAVALLAAIGGGAYFMMNKAPSETAAKVEVKKIGSIDLPDMTINLAGSSTQERQQFLKLKLSLEVADPKLVQEITPMLPRVQDTFQVFMRELRPSDLEGSAGLYRLKEELMRRVNVAVYPNKVDAVNFKEILVQ